jgi:hypothetical protein
MDLKIDDPRSVVWRLVETAIVSEMDSNQPDRSYEGLIGVHHVALLPLDPVNLSDLCGWESVLVPKWLSSSPGYGIRHTAGLNIWGRDDYTVAQVSAHLLGHFQKLHCEGIQANLTGPRIANGGFYVCMFTLQWMG